MKDTNKDFYSTKNEDYILLNNNMKIELEKNNKLINHLYSEIDKLNIINDDIKFSYDNNMLEINTLKIEKDK